jgi:hypothetical protein
MSEEKHGKKQNTTDRQLVLQWVLDGTQGGADPTGCSNQMDSRSG